MLWFIVLGVVCLLLVLLAMLTGVFSGLRCVDHQGELDLSGQLQRGHSYAMLPVVKGENTCSLKVKTGRIRLNHMAYNTDGGTWSLPPLGRQRPHWNLQEGDTLSIPVTIHEVAGHTDRIEIVNLSWLRPAKLWYSIET